MSAVRYKKQLAQLEIVLEDRLASLKLLEQENSELKQKERALQSCISGLESGLSATKTVLRTNSLPISSSAPSPQNPSPQTLVGSVPSSTAFSPRHLPAPSSSSSEDTSNTHDSASSSAAPSPLLALQRADSAAVLESLEAKEQQVQQMLNQLGCDSCYTELYSSKLLRRATSDPSRAAAFVTLSREARLKYLIQAIQRMALLLPKYGTAAPATSTGSAQQQLDELIDEVSEMVLTCGLLDPPQLKLDWLMTHLETLQIEPYPDGWWQQVAQTLELTADQKVALKLCWIRVKANKAALTAEHEKLLARLNSLRQQQHQSHKQFGEKFKAVHQQQMPGSAEQLRQRQQQLRAQLKHLAMKKQQVTAAEQQQQQWQQPLVQNVAPCAQYAELEVELQEVERLLFQDLDGQGPVKGPEETLQSIQEWLFEDDDATKPRMQAVQQNPTTDTYNADLDQDLLNPNDGFSDGLYPYLDDSSTISQMNPASCSFTQPGLGFGGMQSGQGLGSDLGQQPGVVGFSDLKQETAAAGGAFISSEMNCNAAAAHGNAQYVALQQQQQWMQPMHASMPLQPFGSTNAVQQQQQQWRSAFGAMAPPAVVQQQAHLAAAAPHPSLFANSQRKSIPIGKVDAAAAAGSSSISASAPAAVGRLSELHLEQDECASLTTVKTAIIEEGEMLLQISSQEQQEIERHLDVIKDRVKMQHFCQLLAFHNAFSKKQLAAFYVVSFPYLPDALSICEALDELGW